jgi:hypothetical protein
MMIRTAVLLALLAPAAAFAQTARPGFIPDTRPPAANSFRPEATIVQTFDTLTGTAPNQCAAGWLCVNNSSPLGTTNWFTGNTGVFTAQAGAGYIAANFNNTTGGTGTISNWLISPQVSFGAGAELRFWTRVPTGGSAFPDRLEVRASTTGTNTGGTATSTGDFSILLGTVNPNLSTTPGTCVTPATVPGSGGYPETWCEFAFTNANGLPLTGSGYVAFRYFVTNAGPLGDNSNYIGIDSFSFVEGVPVAPVAAPVNSPWSLALLGLLLGGLGIAVMRRQG